MRLTLTAAATLALAAGTLVAGSPATAATAHCPDFNSPDKVELDYETTMLELEPGSTVCYKAGTQVFTVVVPDDGVLVSEATNKHGKPLGISYYIPTDTPPPLV